MPSKSESRVLPGVTSSSWDIYGQSGSGSQANSSQFDDVQKSWTNTPGYRVASTLKKRKRKLAKHLLPTNLYSYRKTRYNVFSGDFKYFPTAEPFNWTRVSGYPFGDAPGYNGTNSGQYCFVDIPSPNEGSAEITAAELDADRSILEKCKNLTVDLGAFVAERKQIGPMFEDMVKRIQRIADRTLRKDYVGALTAAGVRLPKGFKTKWRRTDRDTSKSLADLWLQLQYGLIPLASDLHSVVERLHEKRLKGAREGRRLSSTRRGGSTVPAISMAGLGDAIDIADQRITRWAVKKTIVYKINYTSATGTLTEWGITNPLTWIWEATPWSFVVDWVVGVGDYLHSLDATNGLTFVKGTSSFRWYETVTRIGTGTTRTGPLGTWTYTGAGKGSRLLLRLGRTPINGFPTPPAPKIKNPFSDQHVANGLALLRQGITSPWRR